MPYTQSQVFLFFFLLGIVIGFLYDIFRCIRKNYNTSNLLTQIEDFIFLIIAGFILLLGIIKINNGELRFYIFLSNFLGIISYFLTISRLCVIIINIVVKICKKLTDFVVIIIKKIFKLCKKRQK